MSSAAAADVGDDAQVSFGEDDEDADKTRLVRARRAQERASASGTAEIELAVDTSRLYFFDPETRETI